MEKKDVVDDLADLAELSATDVEVISGETEEGQMLRNAFGGRSHAQIQTTNLKTLFGKVTIL